MAYTITLLIIFDNEKEKEKEISNVSNFGVNDNGYWFEKNEYKSFLNKDKIIFFGRKFDYEEKESDCQWKDAP